MNVPPDGLTKKELGLARMVAEGHGQKEIAIRLGRPAGSIHQEIRAIRDKLGVDSTLQLCSYVWNKRFEKLLRETRRRGQGPNAVQSVL